MKIILLSTLVIETLISFFLIDLTRPPIMTQKREVQYTKQLTSPVGHLLSPAPIPTAPEKKHLSKKLFVMASIPYWDQQRAFDSFRKNVDVIDEISLFWYFLRADGSIAKYSDAIEDESIISFAKKNKVKTLALFANLPDDEGDWDSNRVDKVISNPSSRLKHIQEIVSIVTRLGFDGANIDYENLREDQKDNFTVFIKELATELDKHGKRLRVPVFTRTDNDHTNGQDFIELSKVVDELGFMTYNQHYEDSEPGSVASIDWVRDNINFALNLGVPRDVIFLGIPLYGYDWPKSGGKASGLEYDEVSSLIAKYKPQVIFDQKSASPYFEYNNRIVWFENGQSVEAKIKLAQDLNLAGIALWRLGGEDPQVWDILRKLNQK